MIGILWTDPTGLGLLIRKCSNEGLAPFSCGLTPNGVTCIGMHSKRVHQRRVQHQYQATSLKCAIKRTTSYVEISSRPPASYGGGPGIKSLGIPEAGNMCCSRKHVARSHARSEAQRDPHDTRESTFKNAGRRHMEAAIKSSIFSLARGSKKSP